MGALCTIVKRKILPFFFFFLLFRTAPSSLLIGTINALRLPLQFCNWGHRQHHVLSSTTIPSSKNIHLLSQTARRVVIFPSSPLTALFEDTEGIIWPPRTRNGGRGPRGGLASRRPLSNGRLRHRTGRASFCGWCETRVLLP